MTLDDLEFQSALIAEAGYPLHDQEAVTLARALLAMLPVVRAAERVERGCHCDYDYRCGNCQAVVDVLAAIDTMRGVLG